LPLYGEAIDGHFTKEQMMCKICADHGKALCPTHHVRGEKVRELTEAEHDAVRDLAMEMFAEDASNDIRYAIETVEHLAIDKPNEWWLEFISSDPECVVELLGFDPYLSK
jgi:hypothetical protein